jgi:hypothetical protein
MDIRFFDMLSAGGPLRVRLPLGYNEKSPRTQRGLSLGMG